MAFSKGLGIANKILSAVATITAVLIVAFALYMIYENAYLQHRAYSSTSIQYKPDVKEETVSVEDLMANIPEAIGWITLDNTHIDYPIVQGEDNLYYASRDIYQDPSLTGAIYLQTQNASDFTESYNLLYGHHMDNGAMFGDLTKYLDPDFFSSHLTGTLVTSKEVFDIEAISVVQTDAYEDALYDITFMDWNGYTSNVLNNGNIMVVNQNNNVTYADKFLVLSTCEGAATDGRILLICKLIETQKEVEPVITPASDAGQVIVKKGDSGKNGGGWALLDLCCLIVTFLTVIPYLMDRDDKKKDQSEQEKKKKRSNKKVVGLLFNVVMTIISLVIFIIYEDMRQPMIIKDKCTPWMLIILAAAVLAEELLLRRKKKDKDKGVETANV